MNRCLLSVCFLLLCAFSAAAQPAKTWAGASWIWDQPQANTVPQTNEPRYVRRAFELTADAAKAELWVAADNVYTAYLNEQKIGEGSKWEQPGRYDVTKQLRKGKNVLAIVAQNAGGVAGLIARLHIKSSDKKEVVIATDGQMRVSLKQEPGWLKADFDDADWAKASVLGAPGMAPWNLGGSAVAAGTSYDTNAVDASVKTRLSAAEQHKHFKLPEGFTLELVADDPIVINPITMTIDEKGRIYVSESHTYRYGPPGSPIKPYANPVVRLEPLPDGKLKRVLIADGFADPVMGIAVRGDKLWLSANNYLYQYDLPADGKAINKKTILTDKNKAWNPFGMFVLEWGPDGLLYMSVGDHNIAIEGPDGKLTGRGHTGVIMRMNADGTKMERLVQGLRVPYSFEYDPFGQLWLLSNGEGNPNRFLRVIEGVDYHCFTRKNVDNSWLAGNHPLAPPVAELHRGANTQLLRYFGAAWPAEYQGNLFPDNWGAHGFMGPNRAIFRFVPDEMGKIVKKEPFLSCTDPHFRPSHIVLDPDGNMLVSDWYGRDDESDLTGRIWRVKYTGKNAPKVAHTLTGDDWAKEEYAIGALGSPHHLIREKAVSTLLARGPKSIPALRAHAGAAPEALGAAHALWTLARLGTPEAQAALADGASHADAHVRRLALKLLRRYQVPGAAAVAAKLGSDANPMVRVEAAQTLTDAKEIRAALVAALESGAADVDHLRYETAWVLAAHAEQADISKLLASEKEMVRLSGMIAIDVACYEKYPTLKAALASLGAALATPGKADPLLLLTLAQLDGDASITPSLEKLLAREDISVAVTAKAILVLRAKGGSVGALSLASARKRFLEAVDKGAVAITTPADQLALLEFLDAEGPTEFALRQLGQALKSTTPGVRPAAHVLARRFGTKATSLSKQLWPMVQQPQSKLEDAVEALTTLALIESPPSQDNWVKLLNGTEPSLRTEAVRWWRSFKGQPKLEQELVRLAPDLVKKDEALKHDLAIVLSALAVPKVEGVDLPALEKDKEARNKQTLAALLGLSAGEKTKRAILGKQVFDRASCVKCHTTATQTTTLAPSLKGVAAQKLDYLVESVLYPSRTIKTGFETEVIVTKQGQTVQGLVKEEGDHLRVFNLDKEVRIAKKDVDERTQQRISIMPEGLELQMSRRELEDLVLYLATLK